MKTGGARPAGPGRTGAGPGRTNAGPGMGPKPAGPRGPRKQGEFRAPRDSKDFRAPSGPRAPREAPPKWADIQDRRPIREQKYKSVRPPQDEAGNARPERRPRDLGKVLATHEFKEQEGLVSGMNPVIELLKSGGRPVDAVYIDSEKGGKQFALVISLAREAGVTVKIVPKQALDNMAPGMRHQGVVATVPPKAYADVEGLVEAALKSKNPLIVVLDGVEDPHNLGAIIRTVEACGADGVVIPEHRSAHLTGTVARASAGALEHVPIAKVPNIAAFLDFLRAKSFWTVGFSGDAAKEYTQFDMNVPLAVVLGGEGAGIRPVVKKSCDAVLRIPMLGKVGSLNVSVSAGIVLYEAVRQRGGK